MYATLGLKGYYPMESAYTLNQPNTNFPSHTDRSKTIGVDLTTGSLGQGMSEAIGAALGNRAQNRPSRVYVAVGDGECDEGQIWKVRSLPHTTSWITSFVSWTTTAASWTARLPTL